MLPASFFCVRTCCTSDPVTGTKTLPGTSPTLLSLLRLCGESAGLILLLEPEPKLCLNLGKWRLIQVQVLKPGIMWRHQRPVRIPPGVSGRTLTDVLLFSGRPVASGGPYPAAPSVFSGLFAPHTTKTLRSQTPFETPQMAEGYVY